MIMNFKNGEIKFKPRIKLNHNNIIYMCAYFFHTGKKYHILNMVSNFLFESLQIQMSPKWWVFFHPHANPYISCRKKIPYHVLQVQFDSNLLTWHVWSWNAELMCDTSNYTQMTAIKICFNDLQVHQFIQIITVAHWLFYYMYLTNES